MVLALGARKSRALESCVKPAKRGGGDSPHIRQPSSTNAHFFGVWWEMVPVPAPFFKLVSSPCCLKWSIQNHAEKQEADIRTCFRLGLSLTPPPPTPAEPNCGTIWTPVVVAPILLHQRQRKSHGQEKPPQTQTLLVSFRCANLYKGHAKRSGAFAPLGKRHPVEKRRACW